MPLKSGPDYNGPSAIAEVLEKTDPRMGDAYREAGFPDLPRFAAQLGAGAAEMASLGVLKAPQPPTTTPEVIVRGLGSILGSTFIPLGPAMKVAGKLGVNKTAAGAVANVAAAEISSGGEAELSQVIMDGAFGALYGRMHRVKKGWQDTGTVRDATSKRAFVKGLGDEGVLKDPGVEFTTPESGPEKTLRMAQETMQGKKPREFIPTTFRRLARTHPDPDIRRYAARVENFHRSIKDKIINIADIDDARTASLGDQTPPNLTPDTDLTRIIQEAAEDRPLLRRITTGISELSGLRPPKAVFMDTEFKTGGAIRGYTDVFMPGTSARRAASDEIGKVGRDITNQISRLPQGKKEAMLQWLRVPVSERPAMASSLNLSASDQDRAMKVRDQLAGLFERNFPGDSFDDYLTNISPRLANANPQQLEMLRNHRTAGPMLNYAASSELNLRARDLDRFAAGHVRALSMMHHFDPTYKKIMGLTYNDKLPSEFREYVRTWAQNLRGTDASFAKAFNPHYKQFLNSIGVDATDADVRSLVNGVTQLTHAGLIGFRPGPLIRNLFNPWQTGSRIGLDWTWRGMKKAMTRDGWAEAKRAGMIEEEVLHEVEAMRELAGSRASRVPARIAETSLRMYGKVDDFNRATMYLGMRDRFLSAAKGAGRNEGQLLQRGGLYRFHPVIRDQVMSKWRAGEVKEAAHLMGVHAAQDTQWVYQSGFRPTAMSGELRRAFLQFGVWPANYFEYMRQMATMPNTPTIEKAKWVGEWALGNAGIVATFGVAGSAVGLGPEAFWHTMKWTNLGPAAYAGGPIFDLVRAAADWNPADTVKQIWEGGDLTKAALASDFGRKSRDFMMGAVPGSGVARDIARAKGMGAEMMTEAVGPGVMRAAGMNYPNQRPSRSAEQELFRAMTGVGKE